MNRRHNYPINRKPTKPIKCPVCAKRFKARGIVNHIKLAHGIEYVEIGKIYTLTPPQQLAIEKPLEEILAKLLNQLAAARKECKAKEYSSIVHEIAALRERMGWSQNDISNESDEYMCKFRMLEAPEPTPALQKRLVVMFEDSSHREINFSDYADIVQWLDKLQQIKEEFKARISRYKDIPALMEIEKTLSGISFGSKAPN